jgi:hypothetical protein
MKVDENLAVVRPIFRANIDTWNAPKCNMRYRGLDALDVRFVLGRPLEFHYLSKLVPVFEVGGVRKRGMDFAGSVDSRRNAFISADTHSGIFTYEALLTGVCSVGRPICAPLIPALKATGSSPSLLATLEHPSMHSWCIKHFGNPVSH